MPLAPERLRRPRVPAVPLRSRAFEVAGRKLTPFADLDFPIQGNQDEDLQAEFEAWRLSINGSFPEFITWKWLVEQKKQRPGVDFLFQYPVLGGRTMFGGFLLDFYFPRRGEGWRVNGERFHLRLPKDRARDILAKVILTQKGLKVIDLWETDLLVRPDFVLNLAWNQSASVPARPNR